MEEISKFYKAFPDDCMKLRNFRIVFIDKYLKLISKVNFFRGTKQLNYLGYLMYLLVNIR